MKDFTSTSGYENLEPTSFARVVTSKGETRVVKKSTIVWCLETSWRGLSSDRLQRVQQSGSQKEQRKAMVITVGKQVLTVWDLAIFNTLEGKDFFWVVDYLLL